MLPEFRAGILYPPQGHTFVSLFKQITPGTVFVVAIIVGLAVMILIFSISHICPNDKVQVSDMKVAENLDPFFWMLQNKSRESWFHEEVECYKRTGMRQIKIDNLIGILTAKAPVN